MKKNILVVAAHPDDEILGCGGTLAKYSSQGHNINILFLTNGVSSRSLSKKRMLKLISTRKSSAQKAKKIIGAKKTFFLDFKDNQLDSYPLLKIIKPIERIIFKIKPDTIYTHFEEDLNIDHQVANKAVVTICRPQKSNSVKEIFFFEIPSSTEWQVKKKQKFFSPNYFEDISKVKKYKINALKCYKSELKKWPHPRSIKGVTSLFNWRGATIGVEAAEAFMVGRIIR